MGDSGRSLEEARTAFARRDWAGARDAFLRAGAVVPLEPDDLDRLADASWWLGHVDEALATYEEEYRARLAASDPRGATMPALSVAGFLALRGQEAQASGWFGRAQRLLSEEPDCAEQGYLAYMEVAGLLGGHDLDAAARRARDVQECGRRFGDATLTALGLLGEGVALARAGRVAPGMRLLDDAMVTATSETLDPTWVGHMYCTMIDVCYALTDLRRAGEWTAATTRWCEGFPSAVMFAGVCRVHRAQLLKVSGAWGRAEEEAARVCTELASMNAGAVAEAHYTLGELGRLRGDTVTAEEAYRQAHALGRDPQPGLALLRLAQGQGVAAVSGLRSALTAATEDRLHRARLLAAQVEVAAAVGDPDTAAVAGQELGEIADAYGGAGLAAMAAQAQGVGLLAQGRPGDALRPLQEACRAWRDLDAPYELLCLRVALEGAYEALGDVDSARLEREAAREAAALLGVDVPGALPPRGRADAGPPGGLTPREVEVLAAVARGRTNRQIAGALRISDKTVARHLSNIFTKLGLASRSAATAYAYEHGLVGTGRRPPAPQAAPPTTKDPSRPG
jgi:DNA-binding CsgD family transcriptional regulator